LGRNDSAEASAEQIEAVEQVETVEQVDADKTIQSVQALEAVESSAVGDADDLSSCDDRVAINQTDEPNTAAHVPPDRTDLCSTTDLSVASDITHGADAVEGADTVDSPDSFATTLAVDSRSASDVADSKSPVADSHGVSRDDGFLESRIDAHLFGARRAGSRRTAATHLSERDRVDFSDARFDSDLMTDEEALDALSESAGATAPGELPLAAAVAPEFMRHAERNARWHRPKVRIGLAIGAAALAVVLVLQAAHHFRDTAAVRWPGLRPVLAQWCAVVDCAIEPLRRIDAISVESTALAKAPVPRPFRLAIGLRKPQRCPGFVAIDLSLDRRSRPSSRTQGAGRTEFKPTSIPAARRRCHPANAAECAQPAGNRLRVVEIFYPLTRPCVAALSHHGAFIIRHWSAVPWHSTPSRRFRPFRAARSCLSNCTSECLVSGADAAPRVRGLRRQHRLFALPTGRHAARDGSGVAMMAQSISTAEVVGTSTDLVGGVIPGSPPPWPSSSRTATTTRSRIPSGAMQSAHTTQFRHRATSASGLLRRTAARRCSSTPSKWQLSASRSSSIPVRACRCSTGPN
jgi:hypothetical protein